MSSQLNFCKLSTSLNNQFTLHQKQLFLLGGRQAFGQTTSSAVQVFPPDHFSFIQEVEKLIKCILVRRKFALNKILNDIAENKLHDEIEEQNSLRIAYNLFSQVFLYRASATNIDLYAPWVYKDVFGYILYCNSDEYILCG